MLWEIDQKEKERQYSKYTYPRRYPFIVKPDTSPKKPRIKKNTLMFDVEKN